jgi:hypothetical protein
MPAFAGMTVFLFTGATEGKKYMTYDIIDTCPGGYVYPIQIAELGLSKG